MGMHIFGENEMSVGFSGGRCTGTGVQVYGCTGVRVELGVESTVYSRVE